MTEPHYMRNTFLEFEQPLAELENKIEQLRYVQNRVGRRHPRLDPDRLNKKSSQLDQGHLFQPSCTPWQVYA